MRDENGFSMVELIVVVALMAVISAILFGFLDQTTRLTARSSNDVRAEEAAQLALRTMTEDLRGATSIQPCNSATYATCITFNVPRAWAQGTTCPEKQITYALVSSAVQETRLDYPSNCGTPTTAFSGKKIITNVTNSSSAPLFTYYDTNQAQIDPVASASTIPSAASIVVSMQLTYTGGGSTVLNLSSTASLRNNR